MNQNFYPLLSEYLMPTDLCDYDKSVEIRKIAVKQTVDYQNTEEQAYRLYKFVKELPYKYDDWDIKASDTLVKGYGMCSGKANLFVALLRSLNIPARYVVMRCQAEIELFTWFTKQNKELRRILGEPNQEGDHVYTEVFINGWHTYDPARDPALESGMTALGIPIDNRPSKISQGSVFKIITNFDEWAIPRQKAVRYKAEREIMFKLMNEQLDRIRK